MSKPMSAKPKLCGLCGEPIHERSYGAADDVLLDHGQERDCYHRWTVYGERPGQPRLQRPVGAELYGRRLGTTG